MTLLIVTAVCLAAGFWGVDSRPLDAERPTRWFRPIERRI